MSLHLGQLIYTSFPGVGFRTLISARVPKDVQQAFMQNVIYQYWDPYNPPKLGYRAAYLHQVTLEHSLFGWLYNDNGPDDVGRRHIPYFVCYCLVERLHLDRLNAIFTLLDRGPASLIERQSLPTGLDTALIADVWGYQPARVGVTIPREICGPSYTDLERGRLLDLFVPKAESEVISGTGQALERSQQLQLSHAGRVSFMNQPSSFQSDKHDATAGNGFISNANPTTATSQQYLSADESTSSQRQAEMNRSPQQQRWKWGLKPKVTAWALAISMLPVLAVGVTSYIGSQSITKQVAEDRQAGTPDLAKTELALQRQLPLLLIETGWIAALAGVVAAFVANRAVHPALNAAAVTTKLVKRLRRDENTGNPNPGDELVTLEANVGLLEKQLPNLLCKQEAEVEQFQVLMTIVNRIQKSLSEEDVLRTTVESARNALKTDRVVIFRFNTRSEGTFVAESVVPSWPKTLWATVSDSWVEEGDLEQYRNSQVRAVDDVYQAGLNDSYIGLLERFGVKASLVAPILKDDKLFGLLIAHQCSGPRFWQQPEIDLLTQLASQVGYALDHARLFEQIDTQVNQAQIVINITRKIRESLLEEDILKTTVKEVQKVIRSDRVMVYSFDVNWYGTVVAEAVFPGWPKALWAQIKDPCFVEGYVEKYQAGRVEATNDIYAAGLSDCHLQQLEPFAVKANLVAPILKDDKLFGLLIAHQCSGPRFWQQPEIDLLTQLASQVGYALDHARLLDHVEHAYQAAEHFSREQRQQKEQLQGRVSTLLNEGKTAIATLSSEALRQMESVTVAYNQIQAVTGLARDVTATAQQAKLQTQQTHQTVQAGHEAVNQTLVGIASIQQSFTDAANKVKRLHQSSQKLSAMTSLISNITSQLKLQAMNAVLEAARAGEAGQGLAPITEKIQMLIRQLDTDIAEIKPAIAEIQMGTYEASSAIATGTEHVFKETGLVEETQQKLKQIATVNAQVNTLAEELAQVAANQAKTSTAASQSVLEVASLASHISEQSLLVVEPFNKLATTAQELRVDLDQSDH